mgnify:CR=1 FL=1
MDNPVDEPLYRMLWETTSDAVLILDERGRIEFANSALRAVFGYDPAELVGRGIAMLQPEALRDAHRAGMARHLATGEKRLDWRATEARGLHRAGHEFPIEISFSRSDTEGRIRFAGFIRDISERKRFERLLAGQKRVLEAIAGGAPLEDALAAVTRLFEDEFPGTLCTVVLLDAAGGRIARCIGPSVPPAFNAALAGLEIGPEAGSCGAAAWRRETVVSADISSDPRWAPYRPLAREHGLAACWSHPIVARDGRVLGTLAMYSRTTREPHPRELDAMRATAPLAGIAIERTLAEAEMRRVNERLQLVAKATNDAVWDWDLVTDAVWWNEGYRTLFGYRPEETKPTAESWSDHIHPEEKERVLWGIHAVIDTGGQSWSDEYRFRRRDGSWADIYDRGFVVRDATGRATRMIGAMMDISDRKRAEEQLARMAQFDALTGLPNRNLFRDRLGQAIARAHREGWVTAVAFVDLDRFKEINDTLGHAAGDEVLKAVGERLRASLREGDTVARLGGDEFTVILEDVGTLERAAAVARKILAAFEPPIAVDGKDLFISGSIGLAAYPDHGSDAEVLLQHADTAMYHAKGEGRNALKVYAPTMGAEASERRSVEDGLRLALARGEFVLHYQPIVDLAGGAVTGVEALLRWQHPEWGLVAPGRFIQVAEQSGLIVPIGAWVLRRACRQAAAWRDAGVPPVTVSVNLSARQFRKAGLADEIAAALHEAGLEPARLKLEITESLLMDNPQASGALLARLKEMGVTLALDDFGTGYSSLSYLRHFPLDVLKIDQSFVRDLSTDPEDAVIVRAMIGLAHSLQLTLTAEGVETAEQLAFLRAHGCQTAQGYLFSRPLPAAEAEALLRRGAPLGAK